MRMYRVYTCGNNLVVNCSVLQHVIRSIHGRMGMHPVVGFDAGMPAGSNNIHSDLGL